MDRLTELRQRLGFMRAYRERVTGYTRAAASVRIRELQRMIEGVEIERQRADDSDAQARSESAADAG